MSRPYYSPGSSLDAPRDEEIRPCADPGLLARANRLLFERYLAVVEDAVAQGAFPPAVAEEGDASLANLIWMCRTALERLESFPPDKTSRWLGFVQGVLAVHGLVRVSEERDFSRPLFHAAYRAGGVTPPSSMHRSGT